MLRWGSRLCVSSQEAEDLCRAVWNVPAECRDITFAPEGDPGGVMTRMAMAMFQTRKQEEKNGKRLYIKVWGFQSRVEFFQNLHKSKTCGTQNHPILLGRTGA